MSKLSVLIAAAGKGTRAGLPYPKTLHPVEGKPIIIRIIESLQAFDTSPTIVVSPQGKLLIQDCLEANNKKAHFIIQKSPLGMGNAVLQFNNSPTAKDTSDILLVWGDIPFLSEQTVSKIVNTHTKNNNSFTFASIKVNSAYTVIKRDKDNKVQSVIETREEGIKPIAGERDIGLFVFNKSIVLDLLKEELPGKYGKLTNEHGFLYIIKHLSLLGYQVEALPIATDQELISLNKLSDLR